MIGNESGTGRGLGFCGILSIVFIVLKLCHVIDWKWIWVLAPSWISVCIFLFLVLILAIAKTVKEMRGR